MSTRDSTALLKVNITRSNDEIGIFASIDLDGDRIYLFNKLNVLVTHLVRNHLETDNSRVAIVKDGRVIGIGPGKTNVRVSCCPGSAARGVRQRHSLP